MPETVLLVPSELAEWWRAVSASLPKPIFRDVAERAEELVDVGEWTMAALQVTGYIADVSSVALLLVPPVRKLLDLVRSRGGDSEVRIRRRDGDQPPFWVVLNAEASDEELRKQLERFIRTRAGDGDQAPR